MSEDLGKYVRDAKAEGKSQEDIYKELLGRGWDVPSIQKAFSDVPSKGERESTHNKTVWIVVTIGALLVGAGIFSFIASNWQEMSRVMKVSVILISMLVVYGIGWYLSEKAKLRKTATALFILGTIIYGGGIFLVAQMFNIRANWPDGFILWMIGAIVMAFAIESYFLLVLAIPLGIIALIGHPFGIFTDFGYNSFLLTSSLLLIVTTAITFITGFLIRRRMSEEDRKQY